MAEFRWIKSHLLVILMLQCPVAAGEDSTAMARVGTDVTLPCDGVMRRQVRCGNTTWLSSRAEGTTVMELIRLGNVSVQLPKTKSSRLSVTAECSLLIRNISGQDAGRYTCRQFGSLSNQTTDTRVLLSVVSTEEHVDPPRTIWYCTVLYYGSCQHTVEWLRDSDVEEMKGTCSSTVTHPGLPQGSASCAPLRCRVTDKSMKTLELSVGARCERTEWWWFVLMALALATVSIIVVALIIRKKRTKGHAAGAIEPSVATTLKPETDHMMAHPEDDITYSSVSFPSKTKSLVQCNADEGHMVTYSAVNVSPTSAGVFADALEVYASVNKAKKREAVV